LRTGNFQIGHVTSLTVSTVNTAFCRIFHWGQNKPTCLGCQCKI
jgi:hypothetical protein